MQNLSLYDFILDDAPPSMGLTTVNIMAACEEVVIPVALTYLGLDGCAEMVETVRKVSSEQNKPELKVSMVIPTLYRNTALADEILGKLKAYFPDELSATALGFNVKIDEAQSHGKTIWEYAPSCAGAKMLRAIGDELVARAPKKASARNGAAEARA
jgi:chromosome partitioning protein